MDGERESYEAAFSPSAFVIRCPLHIIDYESFHSEDNYNWGTDNGKSGTERISELIRFDVTKSKMSEFLKIYSSNSSPYFSILPINSISCIFLYSLGTCSNKRIFTAYFHPKYEIIINTTMRGRLVWEPSQLYKFPVDFSILRRDRPQISITRADMPSFWWMDTHGYTRISAEESIILVYFKFHTSKVRKFIIVHNSYLRWTVHSSTIKYTSTYTSYETLTAKQGRL